MDWLIFIFLLQKAESSRGELKVLKNSQSRWGLFVKKEYSFNGAGSKSFLMSEQNL